MQVGDKASVMERVEGEECRLWGLGGGRDGKKPQVRRGILCTGEERESGRGRMSRTQIQKEKRVKMAKPLGRRKGDRQTDKRMGESKIRQEITGDRRGFVGKGELSCEVGGAAHLQHRVVRQSEGDDG